MDVGDSIEVGPAWAGHPVGFALLTTGKRQFVAYYDDQRRLTVASRELSTCTWTFTRLPITTNWDSHRYLTLAADSLGYLHLAGNMHNSPLVYFRSSCPCDASNFRELNVMVDRDELRCTYPRFFNGPNNSLMFAYRNGSSGNGAQLFNAYSTSGQSWSRLRDGPLIDGEGKRGVYVDRFRPPLQGPDGYFHLCWVWRESSDPSTTHSPSYMRSRDFVNWEASSGAPLTLPVTLATADVVDQVPVQGGTINGNVCVSADSQGRPILSYHKYDRKGKTQVFNARRQEEEWRIHQTSRWDYRWEFAGGGTIPFDIRIGPVQYSGKGVATQAWQHVQHGTGRWILDDANLSVIGHSDELIFPPNRRNLRSRLLGLLTNHAEDLGVSPDPHSHFVLQWETLAANRDLEREEPDFATMLRVFRVVGKPVLLTGYTEIRAES